MESGSPTLWNCKPKGKVYQIKNPYASVGIGVYPAFVLWLGEMCVYVRRSTSILYIYLKCVPTTEVSL